MKERVRWGGWKGRGKKSRERKLSMFLLNSEGRKDTSS
jgi:hypothetical protein